ncbi:Cyclic nucleotide-gated cation channel alpha-3 [Clonorchis sinensis]|uniref:Cyclic nucleotide-gated cation channel alpha-3 n=1 Tax=Clonorchis sinensis TaxID=79923 RepID=A0A419Q9L3_CLOSI|nr:Cyclic nucleotide-gated cation channel alpha-3 [Clonorchis sinensis]
MGPHGAIVTYLKVTCLLTIVDRHAEAKITIYPKLPAWTPRLYNNEWYNYKQVHALSTIVWRFILFVITNIWIPVGLNTLLISLRFDDLLNHPIISVTAMQDRKPLYGQLPPTPATANIADDVNYPMTMSFTTGRSPFQRTYSEALLLTHGRKDHTHPALPKWNFTAVDMDGPVSSPTNKTSSNSTTDLGQSLTDYIEPTRIPNRRISEFNHTMQELKPRSPKGGSRADPTTNSVVKGRSSFSAKTPFFRFSPSGKGLHAWFGIISLVVTYHLWVIVYRYAFAEINPTNYWLWFLLDYSADLLYLLDMSISLRTGYYEDGVLQFNSKRMRIHYLNSTQFYIDCLSLLPLDFLYPSLGYNSMFRIFRLCKLYKFWQFVDRTERHASRPNLVRSIKLFFYYITILHWNACIYQLASDFVMRSQLDQRGFLNESRVVNQSKPTNHSSEPNRTSLAYLSALYAGMVNLISIEKLIAPNDPFSYAFKIVQAVVGIILFATILGHVSSIISHTSAAQKEFQGESL